MFIVIEITYIHINIYIKVFLTPLYSDYERKVFFEHDFYSCGLLSMDKFHVMMSINYAGYFRF